MKKKQFMSKLAALTMAAMMGLSAVPASAVNVLADTTITADDYVDQAATVSTAKLDYNDDDVKTALAVFASKTASFTSVTGATKTAEAAAAIGKLSASFAKPADSKDATVTVTSITMPTADADGSIKGTATWSASNSSDAAGATYYDLTVSVPFTVTLAKGTAASEWGSLSVVADTKDGNATATGTRVTYTNGVSTNAYTDKDNLTDLEKTVKSAIEGTDTDTDAATAAAVKTKIEAAVTAATHYVSTVNMTSGNGDDPVIGSVMIAVPQSNGKTRYYTIAFSTDKKNGKQKKLAAATDAVSKALTETKAGESDYSVDSENTIDKVIAKVLSDKGYSGIELKTYTITKDSTTDYAGSFTLHIPEVKNSNNVVTEAEVVGDPGTFALKKDGTVSTLTDDFLRDFTNAIQAADFPMYDDTTADELMNYLNSADFKVNDASMKSQGIKASNIVVNSVTGTTHGKNGKADITLTLTDRTGKSVRSSYTDVVAKHSDSTKLKEATDTVTAVAGKLDTSKYQTKGDTSAIALGDTKVNTAFTYSEAAAADTTTVEGIAQKIVKDSLNTVINASVTSAARKLKADYGTDEYTKDADVDGTETFAPVIKVTKYTPATATSEGTADIEVTFRTINDAWTLDKSVGLDKTQTATAKFTLTFGQLKAKASTYIELGGTKYMTLYKDDAKYKDNDPKKEKISGNALSEHVNSTYSYDVSDIADGNDPITWTSSDPSVAIVDATGKITAKGLGTTTITATDANNSSVSDSVAVVVKNNDEYKFVDVQNPNMFYFSPVYAAAEEKVTSGTDDTHFSPEAPVTRAQFITWLYVKAGKPATTVTGQFTDVPADKWYTNAVYWALENGITAGTTPTTFSPDQTMTRGQAMMFLYKAYGKGKTYNRELALQFTDVAETSPFAEAINWGLNNYITHGYTTTQFGTDDPCTRGQAITFLYGAAD